MSQFGDNHRDVKCDAEKVSEPDGGGMLKHAQRETDSLRTMSLAAVRSNQSRASRWEITHLLSMQGGVGVDSLKGQSTQKEEKTSCILT